MVVAEESLHLDIYMWGPVRFDVPLSHSVKIKGQNTRISEIPADHAEGFQQYGGQRSSNMEDYHRSECSSCSFNLVAKRLWCFANQ